jgi:chemotaxis signal transduction protein
VLERDLTGQVVLFRRHGQPFALVVEELLVVLQSPQVHALPLLPPQVAGALVHDGAAIPLLKLVAVGDDTGSEGWPFVIVCGGEWGRVGLPADRVPRLPARRQGWFEDEPDPVGGRVARRFVYDQVHYLLVDIEQIVAELSRWDFRQPPPRGIRRFE